MALERCEWCNLPEEVLVNVFWYLRRRDRCAAAKVCQTWSRCINAPQLWYTFAFFFYMPAQSRSLEAVKRHGKYFKEVSIELDQSVPENREHACKALLGLSKLENKRLRKLSIEFCGDNPYFYAGKEFIEALSDLFSSANHNGWDCLTSVDLSLMTIMIDNGVVDTLAKNHPNLEYLNICNKVLVCKVTPECIIRLVQMCRKLKEMFVFSNSVNDHVFLAFTENDRVSLEHILIAYTREEKYNKKIDPDTWKSLKKCLPKLRVTLKFDHTCPLQCVSEAMQADIPVWELKLETFTYIYDEVRLASRQYHKTLEKLVLKTPLSRNSPELNSSLVELAEQCKKLKEIHVYCSLNQSDVEKILEIHPDMKERGSYTLKY